MLEDAHCVNQRNEQLGAVGVTCGNWRLFVRGDMPESGLRNRWVGGGTLVFSKHLGEIYLIKSQDWSRLLNVLQWLYVVVVKFSFKPCANRCPAICSLLQVTHTPN